MVLPLPAPLALSTHAPSSTPSALPRWKSQSSSWRVSTPLTSPGAPSLTKSLSAPYPLRIVSVAPPNPGGLLNLLVVELRCRQNFPPPAQAALSARHPTPSSVPAGSTPIAAVLHWVSKLEKLFPPAFPT